MSLPPGRLARVRVILNPSAAAGGALRRVGEIGEALAALELPHEIVLTRQRGHARELAEAARQDGVDVIAVAGGDGTLNEVLQAYVSPSGAPVHGPDLAVIPLGTGGDFTKTLGVSPGIVGAVRRLLDGARKSVDLGVLHHTTPDGQARVRAFVNVASFGIGGHVDAKVEAGPKWLGGRAAFFVATLRAMTEYRNASVRVKVDGRTWYEGPAFNVAIANGRFFGGGMMIAPSAEVSDGAFDVVCLGDLTRAEALGLSSRIYRGTHLQHPKVKSTRGRVIEAEPLHPWASVLLDVDGEQPGKLPVTASIAPGAVTFRV